MPAVIPLKGQFEYSISNCHWIASDCLAGTAVTTSSTTSPECTPPSRSVSSFKLKIQHIVLSTPTGASGVSPQARSRLNLTLKYLHTNPQHQPARCHCQPLKLTGLSGPPHAHLQGHRQRSHPERETRTSKIIIHTPVPRCCTHHSQDENAGIPGQPQPASHTCSLLRLTQCGLLNPTWPAHMVAMPPSSLRPPPGKANLQSQIR